MSQPMREPSIRHDGDLLVVEAPTAQEALATVHATYGHGAEIVGAEKVLRGGLWGFFPRELVQLRIRPEGSAVGTPARVTAAPAGGGSAGSLDAILSRLASEESDREEGLGAVLRHHLGITIPEEDEITVAVERPHASTESPLPSEPAWTSLRARRERPERSDRAHALLGGIRSDGPSWTSLPAPAPDAPAVPILPVGPDPAETLADRFAAAQDAAVSVTRPVRDAATPQAETASAVTVLDDVISAALAEQRPALAATATELADLVELDRDEIIAEEPPVERAVVLDARGDLRARDGSPWSSRALLRLGLPTRIVDAIVAKGPATDADWMVAVAEALARVRGVEPLGPILLVGPRAERLAKGLGLPLVRRAERAVAGGPCAAVLKDAPASREWLRQRRPRHWVNVVVGGSGWRGLLFEQVHGLSWAGDEYLGEAIATADALGLPLVHGVTSAGRVLREVSGVDLAVQLREILRSMS